MIIFVSYISHLQCLTNIVHNGYEVRHCYFWGENSATKPMKAEQLYETFKFWIIFFDLILFVNDWKE